MANLIGTAPNQVPTNGSLGTMAFQDADNASLTNPTVQGDNGLIIGNDFNNRTIAGRLPETGSTSGLFTWVFEFEYDDTYSASLFTLDIAAGIAQTSFGRYTFAVECSASSGTQTVLTKAPTTVFEHDLSSFTVASSGTTDKKFTVSVTRGGTENWNLSQDCASYAFNITQGRGNVKLVSLTAV